MNDLRGRWRAISTVLFPALLVPAQLLLFGPFTTYQHNRSEFLEGFWSIAPVWLWLLPVVAAVLAGIGLLLRPGARERYVATLFAAGLLLWAQGNLLVADYGPLYGGKLDFERHEWRTPWEIALWTLIPAAFIWFARRVCRVAPLASQMLLALQTIVLIAFGTVSGASSTAEQIEWRTPHDRAYRLSSERNVIHIVLDGFLSETFIEIAAREQADFDRDFSGFIFFEDHLGAFPTTRASMPAMLSGLLYRNQRPFDEFLDEAHRQSIFTALHGAGYRLTALTFHNGELPPRSTIRTRMTRYGIPTPYGTRREYLDFAAAQLIDLTLFRHAPQPLKPHVYDDDNWLVQRWASGTLSRDQAVRNARPSNHLLFLEDFASRLQVAAQAPVYLFVHLAVPHPPVVVDGECRFIGQQSVTRETYTAQARCSLLVVRRFLDRLRSLGVYDKSAIVLTSDHGWNVRRPDHPFNDLVGPAGPMSRVVLTAMPLLAVKPIGASGPLRRSAAPVTITDIPATVLALAGVERGTFDGRPVLEIEPGTRRPRAYAYHSWQNADWKRTHFSLLHVFEVKGRALDPDSWRFARTIFDSGAPLEPQLTSKRTGLGAVERDAGTAFRQARDHAVVYAPPDARRFDLRFARSPRATRPQVLTVLVDGRPAVTRTVGDDAWHALSVALDPRPGGAPFTIELKTAPPAYDEDGRPLGFRYERLEWAR